MRRSRASAWARDPDSVYAKGIYPRGTFYTGSTKRSSTGASTRIANSDYSLMLDEDGAAKLLGATADADDDVVVQYIPFRRTRSTGNRGSFCFFSSDEIARDTFPLSERNVASADRKRSTSTMRIPVDRIPQPASNQSLLSGRRTNTRNQSISVTVRPEWDEDKTVAYVESENTARCHPRRTVAQQVSIPLTQDGFTDTDNENDQIMYVPVRRSTARQLRFCSVPVAPPSRRSAMERRSVRPYASEMTSAVRCPTPSRRNYGGSEASLGEDSPVLIHAALRGTTDGYMDDEDCSFDHKRMRQRAAGKRFGYNPDSLPSCRLSAVAPGGSKPVGVVRIPPGARQRTGFARRSTRIAATKVRPSTNLVVLERRPRPVSRDEVGDSEKYEPVDVSMSSTASSTELYEAGREPSYSSSRRFVGELDYDEMPIPFVYMPVSDSSLCDTNTARRTSLRPPPGTGGATGGKYASARAVAGQRRSDTRVRGAFFSARGPSASTPDDTDIESGNGEPVDYSPGVNTSGGSFGVSLQKRPSNSTLTGVAALSMADIPLVAAEGSNMMGRRVHPNRVASTLTAQLDHLMLTGRSEDLDERPASQAPRRSVHTQVSDEHEDGIVLVPVRRSVARGEGKEQTKFQAVSRIQDKDEDSWEHENKKASTVQQGFAPVPPQCISNAPAETSVASRKPSGSANTRRKSSVPAVVNDASIIIGSGSVLRQGCYEPDQEWQDTGVVASTSQLKGDAETATARPRGAFRKSSCERARSVVPLASQAKKKVELFDDAKHLTSDVRSLSKGALGRTLQASKRPELLRQNASSRYSSRQSSLPVAAGQNDGVQHRSSERDVREGRGVPLSAAPVGEPPRSHRRQLQRGDELSDDNAHFDHGESSVEKRRCQTGLGGRRSTRLQGSAAAVRAATGRSIAAVEDTKESEAPDVETGVERGEYPEEVSALASCRSVRHSNKGRGRVTMGVSPATDQYILRSSQVYGCRKTMRFAADGNGDEYEESRRKAASWAATPRDSFGGKRSVQENLFTDSDQEEECDGEEGNQTSDNADDFAGGEIASTYDASDSIQAAQEDENGTILVPLRSTRRQTNSSTPRRMSTRVRESESNPSTRKTSSGCCCGFMCCCGPEVLADTPGDSPDMSLATPPQPKDAREKQPKDPLRISITQKRCGQNDVTGEASHNLVTSTRRATLQLPFVTAPRNVCMNTTPAMQRPRRTVERGSLQPTNAVNLRTSVTDRSSSSTEERDAYEDDDAIEGNGSIVDEAEETSVDACAMQPLTTPPAAESPLPVPHTRSAATSPIPPTEELTSRMLSSTSTADQQSSCSSLTRSSQLSRSAPQVTVQVRGTVPPTPPRSPYPVVTQGCSSALPQASSSCPPVGLLNISEHIVAHSSAAKSLNTGRDMDGTPERNQQTRSIPGNCHFGGEGTHRPSQYRSSPPPSAMTAQWKTASVSEAPFSVTEALDSRVTCDASPPSSDGRSGTATLVDAWSREGHTENCPYCRPPCGRESVERNRRKPVSGCDEGRTDSSAAATSNRRVIGNGEVVCSPSSRSRIGSTLFLDHTKTRKETPRHRHRQPVFYNSSLRLTVKRALDNLRKRRATNNSARLCFCNAAASTVCRGHQDYSGWEGLDECKMVESNVGARKWNKGSEKNGSDRTAYAPPSPATRYAPSASPFSSVLHFPSSISSPSSRVSCSSRPSASSSPNGIKKKVDAASCSSVAHNSDSCIRTEDRRQGEEKSTTTANLHMVDERTIMREEHSPICITNDDSQFSRDETERTQPGCSELLHTTEKSHGEAPLRKRSASQENITTNGGESSNDDKGSEKDTVSRQQERKSPLQDGRTGDAFVCVQLEGSSRQRDLQGITGNDAFRRCPSRATPASQPTKHQILLRLVFEDFRGPVA